MSSEIPTCGEVIWVISDVMPDGSYGAVIHFGPDLAHPIGGGAELGTYVTAAITAATAAKYDAAVMAQLTKTSSTEDAVEIVQLLREARGDQEWKAGPMTLTPGVSAFNGKPFVRCQAGPRVWQWAVEDLQNHVENVTEAVVGARDDSRYFRVLTKSMGLDDLTARAVVSGLGQFLSDGA